MTQIAKSLVFKQKHTQRLLLVIRSGVNPGDPVKIQKALNIPLEKAEAPFVKEKTGYTIGGVPPAGHPEPLETVLNTDLKQYDTIRTAAGSSFGVFQLTPAHYEPLTRGRWLDIAESE